MRVDIAYFEGYPELVQELEKFPPRARAERMRLLAALGLSFMCESRSSGTSESSSSPATIKLPRPPKQATPSPILPTAQTNETAGGVDTASRITRGIFKQID